LNIIEQLFRQKVSNFLRNIKSSHCLLERSGNFIH